jgi:hypothetical protein
MTAKRHPAVQELVRRRSEGDVYGPHISALLAITWPSVGQALLSLRQAF